MFTKAKVAALGAALGLTTMIGLAAAPAASAAAAPQTCGYQVSATNLNVRVSPSTTAKVVGQIGRAWNLTGGPGCNWGYATTVTGAKYVWQGTATTAWAHGTFKNGTVKVTGYVAKPALYRCPQVVC